MLKYYNFEYFHRQNFRIFLICYILSNFSVIFSAIFIIFPLEYVLKLTDKCAILYKTQMCFPKNQK